MRATIDFGIDLGTTNSAIACQVGTDSVMIDGPDGLLVPSVAHVAADKSNTVGRRAVELRATDPANVAAEFKRLMGTSGTIEFPASQRCMTPPELSAEVLKHLIRRAERWKGQAPIEAAVITIPAMFQLAQCEATREAASLAGLKYAPLLQEPIAAAIASIGSAELRDGYWLVYDFGGGTFDVSLVRSRDGQLQVLDHDGDNYLGGGKDFDRLLARHAADRVRAEGRIPNFRRGVPALESAFERLKLEAERVRIALSHAESVDFRLDDLAPAADGGLVSLDFPVTRAELESLIRPSIMRTVELCRRVLARHDISPSSLKRLVLVGGPTLTPCLPRIVGETLGVEARHYVDPSHAVAIGAAIYASTQRLPAALRAASPSALSIDLSYQSMTNDLRPALAGQIAGPLSPAAWQVEVSSRTMEFSSGMIPARPNGSFAVRLQLVPNVLNVFELNVYRDAARVPGLCGAFSMIHGTTLAKPVLSRSVGVALADNSVRWYLRKGVVLPARHKASHATTVGLRRGQTGFAVNVPLIQGESDFGDRNTIVGLIEIDADNTQRDLPAGSEVIVTLSIDEHSCTHAEAYVPLLDRTFRQIVKFGLETRSAQEITQGVKGQQDRLAELEKLAAELEGTEEGGVDARVKAIEELLDEGGADERAQADQLLKNLTGIIDTWKVQDQEEHLRVRFAASDQRIRELLDTDDAERKRQHAALTEEFRGAISRSDLQLAEAKFKAVEELEWGLIREQPGFWKELFQNLCAAVLNGPNAAEARVPIDQGKAALGRNDIQALAEACRALFRLLPQQPGEIPLLIQSHIA